MISTANQIAYAMGVTDNENLYTCNTFGAKTGLTIGAINEVEGGCGGDDDNDVYSDEGEEFPPSGNTFFGSYDDDSASYSSDSDSDDGASKRSKASIAAPAAPLVATAESIKLAKVHADLRSNENYSKELLYHENVICKVCGKERVPLQAFDDHVCEPSVLKPTSSSTQKSDKSNSQLTMADFAARAAEANPKLENSSMWHAAMAGIAKGEPLAMFEDGEPIDDLHKYLVKSNAAERKLQAIEKATFARAAAASSVGEDVPAIAQDNANLHKWLREAKGVKDVESYKPSERDYAESAEYVNAATTKSAAGPLKVTKTIDEKAMIAAVVNAEDFKSAFRGTNNAVVMVRGKYSPAQKAYYVKMGFASNSSADANSKKMHKVLKFTTAGDQDPTLSHKLMTSGVDGLHKQFDKAMVASNVETVLNVAKKITDKRNA